MKYLLLFQGMEKLTSRINPSSKHFKNSGEVTYSISPLMERTPSALIPDRIKLSLEGHFLSVRSKTTAICKPLYVEDFVPKYGRFKSIKWHLAHSTWLYEKMILGPFVKKYKQFHDKFERFFSTIEDLDSEGDFSRPSLDSIISFRNYIDDQMARFLEKFKDQLKPDKVQEVEYILHFILNLEMDSQEEILSQIKGRFFARELKADYWPSQEGFSTKSRSSLSPVKWINFPGGLVNIGHDGTGFAYDMEGPKHTRFVTPFAMAQRPVTNGDFLQFIEEDGYERGGLWLCEGWEMLKKTQTKMPKYWQKKGSSLSIYTLAGVKPLRLNEPVSHITYFEADAYARFAKARLPSEVEWEVASETVSKTKGNFLTEGSFHPEVITDEELRISTKLKGMFGDVWEWTTSLYAPYPRYLPVNQSLWKYTGRLEGNKRVLKGGSCLFNGSSFRPTMRKPAAIYQDDYCTGIRLVKDVI